MFTPFPMSDLHDLWLISKVLAQRERKTGLLFRHSRLRGPYGVKTPKNGFRGGGWNSHELWGVWPSRFHGMMCSNYTN